MTQKETENKEVKISPVIRVTYSFHLGKKMDFTIFVVVAKRYGQVQNNGPFYIFYYVIRLDQNQNEILKFLVAREKINSPEDFCKI